MPRGREKTLALIGGLVLPAAVLASIAGTPLWGGVVTFVLVKAIAALFVIVGILWYRADDTPAGGFP